MDHEIIELSPDDFEKCRNIWNIRRHEDLAKQFREELLSGKRITFVCVQNEKYVGEISLVFEKGDPDLTIKDRRVYLSRLIIKCSEREKGIGKALVSAAVEKAKSLGFSEMSVGVDPDNFHLLSFYVKFGFDRITLIEENKRGKYLKLLKRL